MRGTLDALADEASVECAKFSEDVKFWAEFQTGIKVFEPWLKIADARKQEGLKKPVSLVEACEILGDSKNLQDEAEAKLRVLEEAAASSQKMTSHQVSLSLVNNLNTTLPLVSSPHICLLLVTALVNRSGSILY